MQEVKTQTQSQPGSSPVLHSPAMEIFQKMASDLDTEGRYLFLNALANQLRYPNNHTHYFSCVLLYLFSEAKQVMSRVRLNLESQIAALQQWQWGIFVKGSPKEIDASITDSSIPFRYEQVAVQEIIQEQITRVLLERLIVNRPHPWGLLITFIELIKNPRYSFWNYNFTRCAGEIERLFDSVARSCMGTAAAGGAKAEEDVS